MRRHVRTLLVLAIVTAVPASAAGQGFGFGGKAGVNLTSITFERDDTLKGDPRPGLVAGGFVMLPFVAHLRIEVDVLWSERVSEFQGTVTDKLGYVEIPMLVRIGFHQSNKWRAFIVGGVSAALLQRAAETVNDTESDIKSAVKSQEYSAVIGGQFQIGRRWLADVRYLFGFTNVYAATSFPAKQRTWQFSFGYVVK
jgi:Outer membrane protein beta-barrel domain